MAITLTDDGTFDTVLRCSDCGAELRYNYDPAGPDEQHVDELRDDLQANYPRESAATIEDLLNERLYDEFVGWAIEDAESEHECEPARKER